MDCPGFTMKGFWGYALVCPGTAPATNAIGEAVGTAFAAGVGAAENLTADKTLLEALDRTESAAFFVQGNVIPLER